MGYSSAWRSQKEELQSHVEQQGVTVSYVQGPPGSGKATTMITELSALFLQKFPDGIVFSVFPPARSGQPGSSSMVVFDDFLHHTDSPIARGLSQVFGKRENLRCQTYNEFFNLSNAAHDAGAPAVSSPTIVFWHLELIPTYHGEVAMATLITAAQLAVKMYPQKVAIFLLANRESRRTLGVFRQRLGDAAVKHVVLAKQESIVPWKVHSGNSDGSLEWVPAAQLKGHPVNCAILGGVAVESIYNRMSRDFWEFVGMPGDNQQNVTPTMPSAANNLLRLRGFGLGKRPQYITVQHDVSWSISVKGLRTVFSPSHVSDVVLDHTRGSLVVEDRELTRGELETLHSWAYKSAADHGSDVEIVAPYTKEDMESFIGPDADPLGQAWNGDLLFTVLKIREHWGGIWIGDLPITKPPNRRSWLTAESALQIHGCLGKPREPDELVASRRGLAISSWRWKGWCRNWNAAMLLAQATEIELKDRGSVVSRVLCTMAAIVELEMCDRLLSLPGHLAWPDGIDMAVTGIGPGRFESYAGCMWSTFAMFCHTYDFNLGNSGPESTAPGEKFGIKVIIWHAHALALKARVANFSLYSGIDTMTQGSWRSMESLDTAQLAQVQNALANAFLYQVLWFGPKVRVENIGRRYQQAHAVECHSGRSVIVKGEHLLIDFARIMESNPWGFYVFYTGPLRREADGCVSTDQETYIPTVVLTEIAEKRGQRWPDMIARADWGLN